MKNKFECEVCNKIFDKKEECLKHELNHLNLEEKLRKNLLKALKKLDVIYNSKSQVVSIEWSSYYDYYDRAKLEIKCIIESTGLKEPIELIKEINCDGRYYIPTVKKLLLELNTRYYIPQIKQKYEGKFKFYSNEDYYIGDIDINTIYQFFGNKNVRMEVIE